MEDVLAPEQVTQEAPDVAQNSPMTPEEAFDQTQDKSGLIDDFFRANKMDTPSEAQPEPSPVEVPTEVATEEESPVDNDVKRYQYWQSEADKARNENQELAKRLEALEQAQAQPEEMEPIEEDLSFPEPPAKPAKPRNYSRADALEDPDSDSARYLDEVDKWRDDMDEYNRLHQQYTQAVMVEERQRIQDEQREIQRAQSEREAYNNNMAQMKQHLQSNYQASDDEIARFVEVMDDPNNITVDNLFQLYRMQNGGQVAGQQPMTQTAPNESCEQRKRAQSVPSPMGVVPGQSSSQQSGPDSVMDSMINDYKNRNPFG